MNKAKKVRFKQKELTPVAKTNKKGIKALVESETQELEEEISSQERWSRLCLITKEKAKVVMGVRKKVKKVKHINNQQIEEMAKEKHKMQKDVEACTDQNLRKDKMKQKKELKLKIRKKIKEVSTMQLESKLMEIERMKDDSTRYFAAIKEKARKSKKVL